MFNLGPPETWAPLPAEGDYDGAISELLKIRRWWHDCNAKWAKRFEDLELDRRSAVAQLRQVQKELNDLRKRPKRTPRGAK